MIRFVHPQYLILLWLNLLLIAFYIIVFKQKIKAKRLFGNLEILEKMTKNVSLQKQIIKTILIIFSFTFIILALARPQFGTKLEEVKRKGIDLIVALDVSKSMLAEDIKPNRLSKAKQEISTLIDKLQGDRFGLIVFAGDAFVQCPLTTDYDASKMFLDIIMPNIVPTPGTAIGKAILKAMECFEKKERKYKAMILLTDGEDFLTDPIKSAKEANKEGIKIYTVGIGSREGELIPIKDEQGKLIEYKKDKSGNVIMTKLDEVTLQKIALLTGGKYYRVSYDEVEISKIYDEISKMEKRELGVKEFTHYEDRFQYIIIFVLLFLIVELLLTDRKKLRSI